MFVLFVVVYIGAGCEYDYGNEKGKVLDSFRATATFGHKKKLVAYPTRVFHE
jgi:hypothetical protein